MMQWVLAATRPLVLTMGPLVLTMVFCGLGVFSSCSKDDDNPNWNKVMARGTIYNIKVKQGKTQASATTVVSTAEAEVTLVE